MPAFKALKGQTDTTWGKKHGSKPAIQVKEGEEKKSAAFNWPLDPVDCCITEAPDVIVVAVYGAGGGKHQAVTRKARDLDDHHLLPQTAVHLESPKHNASVEGSSSTMTAGHHCHTEV